MIGWFYEGFPKLAEYVENTKKAVLRDGYVVSKFGRIRYFPEFRSSKKAVIQEVYRQAINHPVQSSASDICLESLVCLSEDFEKNGMKSVVVGGVHDSIEIDVHPSEIRNAMKMAKYNLVERSNSAYPWMNGIPIEADFAIGRSWLGGVEYKPLDDDYTSFSIKGRERDIEDLLALLSMNYRADVSDVLKSTEAEKEEELFRGVYDAGPVLTGRLQIVW